MTKYRFAAYAILVFAILAQLYSKTKHPEHFVAFNAYEVPDDINDQKWAAIYGKFGQLTQLTNAGSWGQALRPDSRNLTAILLRVINALNIGQFVILSVGDVLPFTLLDVLVQETKTLTVSRYARIDFVISQVDPYVVDRIIMTPSAGNSSVTAFDALEPELSRFDSVLDHRSKVE